MPLVTDAGDVTPEQVLAFWRAALPGGWYKKDAAFDAALRERFSACGRS